MKLLKTFLALVGLAVIVWAVYWLFGHPKAEEVAISPGPTVTVTASPEKPDHTISDGTITLGYRLEQYGLATTPAQVLVTSYIPSCSPEFNYCLYYTAQTYKGTNFDSAGLRIQKRTDLTNQSQCLSTLPTGYTGIVPTTVNGPNYSASVFSPLGDGAMGHYASGAEYRLWTSNKCYEFETRIGESQFANYPAGTVKEFTAVDRANVKASLRAMLDTVTISNGESVSFPQAK